MPGPAGAKNLHLAADLEAGEWPCPRCPAEEVALHLILRDVPAAVDDGWARLDKEDTRLPALPDDFNWDLAQDVLFQDTDILALFNPDLDGIEDPGGELNLQMSIGDYRPQAWYEAFANMGGRNWDRTSDPSLVRRHRPCAVATVP
jgi:hypothetical protein